MKKEIKVFKRNYLSHLDITILIALTSLLTFSIILFLTKSYLGGVLVIAPFTLILYRYLRIPKSISIDYTGFEYGNTRIDWEDVVRVVFTVGVKDYRDTSIIVELKDKTHTIHAKYFKNSKVLRNFFEELCNEKLIKFVVEDLYTN